MPLINSPLPRAPQPRFHQGSSLRSVRDSDRPDRSWSKTDKTSLAMRVVMSQLAKVQQELGRLRRRIVGGGGSNAVSGMDFGGEYDPAVSYKAKTLVLFTPEGGAAGSYVSLVDVSGISPDTGKPNWVALPNSPPGVWG